MQGPYLPASGFERPRTLERPKIFSVSASERFWRFMLASLAFRCLTDSPSGVAGVEDGVAKPLFLAKDLPLGCAAVLFLVANRAQKHWVKLISKFGIFP